MCEKPTTVSSTPNYRPDGSKMKALVWYGIEDVRMDYVPISDITDDDDVIVKVTGTTICGSDLHLYDNALSRRSPSLVVNVIIASKSFSPSAIIPTSHRKTLYFLPGLSKISHYETFICSLQMYMFGQKDSGIFGYSHFTGGYSGGQTEFVRVPKAEVNLLLIAGDIPDEKVLYLSDILPTSYHCVVDTGVKEGDVVGIWGLGPIGMCAARWAQIKGASRVIGIDKYPARLDMARNKLGIEVVDFSTDADVVKRIYELVPRGLDVALNCSTPRESKSLIHKVQKLLKLETDVPENVNEMMMAVKKGGRCGLIGDNVGFANGFNIGALMEKGIRLIGNGQAPVAKYWHKLLNDYILPAWDSLVTHRVPLEDTT
ncbi:hypothetical protein Clacol_005081 [Clathrus columnatus]|uniref:Alcohol dehydrogenase-like C-terminal domain-containing protein n=1 Tax=Clathrus columnatus TaxID=1419009 RepID=A0AAV5ACI8_9AGAM|nr:hypothetical protein Clacol_005081 [Clathrus columnatus]